MHILIICDKAIRGSLTYDVHIHGVGSGSFKQHKIMQLHFLTIEEDLKILLCEQHKRTTLKGRSNKNICGI